MVPSETLIEDKAKFEAINGTTCDPIPKNKVDNYCEGEKTNKTTFSIELNNMKSQAISYNGVGIAI